MSISETLTIRAAGLGDMTQLGNALTNLSVDLGDTHRTDTTTLAAACHGENSVCHGLLALSDNEAVGAVLVSPLFSTTRGTAGAYVTDLWVSRALRGTGLGGRLLGAAARHALAHWNARFLKLMVYEDNKDARAFYDRLGFGHQRRDQVMILGGVSFDNLLDE